MESVGESICIKNEKILPDEDICMEIKNEVVQEYSIVKIEDCPMIVTTEVDETPELLCKIGDSAFSTSGVLPNSPTTSNGNNCVHNNVAWEDIQTAFENRMKTATKRKRAENWDSEEKQLLRELVKEQIDIIEDKRTDTNTSHMKRDAWANILKRFNEVNKKERGLNQLQFQWRNTKMRLKAQSNRYRVLVNGTGGGPRPASPKGEDAEIMALIPKEFEVDFNIFDNDGPTQQALDIRTGIIINKAHIDPKNFLDECGQVLRDKVNIAFQEDTSLKINAILCAEFKLIKGNTELYELKHIDNKSSSVYKHDDILKWYLEDIKKPILNELEEFQEQETGWTLSAIVNLRVNITKFTMQLGSAYIDLPPEIKAKRACINVANTDNACFAWAVVSALYATEKGSNKPCSYPLYTKVLSLEGIRFPMQIEQIPRFEMQNNVSINVYILKLTSVKNAKRNFLALPTYVSKDVKKKHVNLLLIQDRYYEENCVTIKDSTPVKYHYVWIKHLSRLLSAQLSANSATKYFCNRCLRYFLSKKGLTAHEKNDCMQDMNYEIKFPPIEENILAFKNNLHKIKTPFVIYAKLECLSTKSYAPVPSSIAYFVKCAYDPTLSFYKFYRGANCKAWFEEELHQLAEDLEPVYLCEHPKNQLLPEERRLHEDPSILCVCSICEKPIPNSCKRITNHCRFTGAYRGPAHDVCNMTFRALHTVPVIFHNLNNNDVHFIIENIASDFECHIALNVIKNKNRFVSFPKHTKSLIKYRFIDSYNFMADSLDNLASNSSGFPILRSQMSHLRSDVFNLLTKESIYPVDYFDRETKFMETSLPPIEEFGNIAPEDYEHAKNVWNEFKLVNLAGYADLCLKTDILLLADIFEEFRNVCFATYELDPCYYYTIQEYSWDVMLKHTNIAFELLTDIDMVDFIERGTRGDLSQCSMRYSKANNKYLANYNCTQPMKYLMHFRINEQTNWAMSQYLPYRNFRWVDNFKDFDAEAVADESPIGYVLEVDLDYPVDTHNLHKDLPFCPEYQNTRNSKRQEKLVATLNNKFKYVIHYRNLKQAIKHGLQLKRIHRILQFEQLPWLKGYIDFNRSLTASATKHIEKVIFKQMNYSVFAKAVENFRDAVRVRLVRKWPGKYEAELLISKPEFKSFTIINENLVALKLNYSIIHLNKPIYVGMCLHDLMKTKIYEFHYQCMQAKFGVDCVMCYFDSDSLLYEVETPDIYESIRDDRCKQFNTSCYSQNNICNIAQVNRNVMDMVEDRYNGKVMSEFVGLRSKMYAVMLEEGGKAMKIKVAHNNKQIVSKRITFSDYLDCLENETKTNIGLSSDDNKRQLIEKSYVTLPWGHYRTRCDFKLKT